MWRNFFTVALRNISKNKVFTLINVSGLAIGLASSILIILFVIREVSFDRFHENRQRIYRLYIDGTIGDQTFRGALTSMVMAQTFAEEIPEIEKFVRFDVYNQKLIWSDGEKHIEDHFLYADSTIFDIFSLNFVNGDPSSALSLPYSIVITEEKAKLYFGDRDPLGQLLVVNDEKYTFRVTGVIESLPENSHFFADFIASMSTIDWEENVTWFQNSVFSYVLLQKGSDPEKVEKQMAEVLTKHIRSELRTVLGVGPEQWAEGGNKYGVYLQPLLQIHLQPDIEVGIDSCFRPVNDRLYIHIFGLVAFFILAIASINFMNLSTARAASRAREIGLRKAAGSHRSLLVNQFLTESVILSFISLVIALIIVELSMPWFNRVMDLDLRIESMKYVYFLPLVCLLTLLVGLISGAYPAFFLSRFNPVEGIKGERQGQWRAGIFRRILVIAQFTISVGIIVGTLIVSHQLKYMLDKDLGYDKEQLVVLQRTHPLMSDVKVFCREIEKIPGVVSASSSTTYLGFNNSTESYMIEGRKASHNFLFATNHVDPEFMKTCNFALFDTLGRFFDPYVSSDTSAIVINQAAVEEFDIDDPYRAVILETNVAGDTNRLHVIGVVENFHHSTLREVVGPYMIRYKKDNFDYGSQVITVRLGVAGKGIPITLNQIKQVWMKMTGEAPFQFFFLDEELDNYYKEERRTGRLSLMFAILATFIACLGLFGLTLHNTKRRTREIGIRKAMGATIGEVILVVSREILVLMLIAVLLAWIAAYLFMQNWLQGFPFNIGFQPWIYLVSALTAMFIALLTVTLLAWREARSNPARTLHYE
jgi:putative ABC transport system permease protein